MDRFEIIRKLDAQKFVEIFRTLNRKERKQIMSQSLPKRIRLSTKHSEAEKVEHIRNLIVEEKNEEAASTYLYAWLERRLQMVAGLLDFYEIHHSGEGWVLDEAVIVKTIKEAGEEKLKLAIETLSAKFPKLDLAIYLAYQGYDDIEKFFSLSSQS